MAYASSVLKTKPHKYHSTIQFCAIFCFAACIEANECIFCVILQKAAQF